MVNINIQKSWIKDGGIAQNLHCCLNGSMNIYTNVQINERLILHRIWMQMFDSGYLTPHLNYLLINIIS